MKISVIDYDESKAEEPKELKTIEECYPHFDDYTKTSWVNIVRLFGAFRNPIQDYERGF